MFRAGTLAACAHPGLFRPAVGRTASAFIPDEFKVYALSASDAFQRFGPALNEFADLKPELAALEQRVGLWAIARGWRSRVHVICKGEKLVAAILLRERLLLGIPTGYFIGGDDMGDICVLSEAAQRRHVLRWFFQWLLQRNAFVLHLQSSEAHSLSIRSTDLWSGCSMHKTRVVSRWRHALGATFDDSIGTLGKRTRRNLRHSLRTVAQQSWQFVPSLTQSETEESIRAIDARATYPASQEVLDARLRLRNQLPGFFSAGLRDAHGNWLSTISGVRVDGGTTRVLWQHNATYPGVSLCTVMRALLIQAEVKNGSQCIEYFSGTNSLMEHYCHEGCSTRTIFLKRGLRFGLFRLLLRFPVASRQNVLRSEILAGEI